MRFSSQRATLTSLQTITVKSINCTHTHTHADRKHLCWAITIALQFSRYFTHTKYARHSITSSQRAIGFVCFYLSINFDVDYFSFTFLWPLGSPTEHRCASATSPFGAVRQINHRMNSTLYDKPIRRSGKQDTLAIVHRYRFNCQSLAQSENTRRSYENMGRVISTSFLCVVLPAHVLSHFSNVNNKILFFWSLATSNGKFALEMLN